MCLAALSLFIPSGAHAQGTTTYYLHRENSSTEFGAPFLLSPDAVHTTTMIRSSSDLKGVSSRTEALAQWRTAVGVPALSGQIPSGSTVSVTLWLKKTASWGTVYPYATMKLNDAFGAFFCTASGTQAVTTTFASYAFLCVTTQAITMTSTDRLLVFAGYTMPQGPSNHSMQVQLQIEGAYNSRFVMPNPTPTAPAPTITTLSPGSGLAGTSVTISGANFGQTQGTSSVTFNGVSAQVTNWSNTSLTVTVPAGAATGPVVISVGSQASNVVTFSVIRPPHITSLTPSAGSPGSAVTISGTDFGYTQGTSTVSFNGAPAVVANWTDTAVQVVVPSDATTGSIMMNIVGNENTTASFIVTGDMVTIAAYEDTSAATYHYRVINGDNRSVVGFQIGNDSFSRYCELTSIPLGWTLDGGMPTGVTTAPTGWTADAFTDEDTGGACVVFMSNANDSATDLAHGADVESFSVHVDSLDDAYSHGSVTVIFDDGTTVLTAVEPIEPPL